MFRLTLLTTECENQMLGLLILSTVLSLFTVWLVTRSLDPTSIKNDTDKEDPSGEKRKEKEKASFKFLAAWMAAISMEEPLSLDEDEDTYDYALSDPPERHPSAAGYCPKCKAQFRQGFDRCNTCDLALILYEPDVIYKPDTNEHD